MTMAHCIRLSLLCRCKWTRKSQVSYGNCSEQYLLLWNDKKVYCVYTRIGLCLQKTYHDVPRRPMGNTIGNSIQQKDDLLVLLVSYIYRYFGIILEKGIVPTWWQGIYDQLLPGIRNQVVNIFNLVNKSVNYWTCQLYSCHL